MAGNSAGSAIGLGVAQFADSINKMLMENTRASEAKDLQASQINAQKNASFLETTKANEEANYTQANASFKALALNPNIDTEVLKRSYENNIKNLKSYGAKANDLVLDMQATLAERIGKSVVNIGPGATAYADSQEAKDSQDSAKAQSDILKQSADVYTDKVSNEWSKSFKESGVADNSVTVNLGGGGTGLGKDMVETDAALKANAFSLGPETAKSIIGNPNGTTMQKTFASLFENVSMASSGSAEDVFDKIINDENTIKDLVANENLILKAGEEKLSSGEVIRQLEYLKNVTDPLGALKEFLGVAEVKKPQASGGMYQSSGSEKTQTRLDSRKAEATADAIAEIALKINKFEPNQVDATLRELLDKSVIDIEQANEIERQYIEHIAPKAMVKEESWLDSLLGIRNYREEMATPFNPNVGNGKISDRIVPDTSIQDVRDYDKLNNVNANALKALLNSDNMPRDPKRNNSAKSTKADAKPKEKDAKEVAKKAEASKPVKTKEDRSDLSPQELQAVNRKKAESFIDSVFYDGGILRPSLFPGGNYQYDKIKSPAKRFYH